MFKKRNLFFFLLFLFNTPAGAADVVFLGAEASRDQQESYPDFSVEKRASDLIDFSSYGQYGKDRSGMITGTLETSLEYTSVSGNKSKSFYDDSKLLYQSDLGLKAYEKLWQNYQFEGAADLRLTSNEQVENQETLRLKQLNLKVSNPQNIVEFGNFYSEFSRFTMGSSLEGLNAEFMPEESKFGYKAVLARLNDAEIGQNQRNVFGGHIEASPFKDDDLSLHDLKLGAQAVLTQDDDGSSFHDDVAAPDLYNWVVSTDGRWRHRENGFGADWEFAVSEYNEDMDVLSNKTVRDSAVSLSPSYRYKNKFDVRYLYYLAGPDFYTMTGSAVRDKQQHMFNANYRFSSSYTLSAVQNWYWDNLPGSTKTKRTKNSETNLSLNARPIENHQSFSIRPYAKKIVRDSDDAANSASSKTTILGMSVNDTYKEASLGAFVEKRDYKDMTGSNNSEDYMRYGMNFSRDFVAYDCPLYISAGYSGSVRDPQSENGNEVQNGFNLNGRLQISEPSLITFGHNMQITDSAGNIDDYKTNTSFTEYAYKFMNKRDTELKLRGERNDYNYDNNAEDYREKRFVASLVTHF